MDAHKKKVMKISSNSFPPLLTFLGENYDFSVKKNLFFRTQIL